MLGKLFHYALLHSLYQLHSILYKEAFDHYLLFIKSLFTLLKTEITDDLSQCEYDLIKFIGYYEIYYGVKYMTFNVHTLVGTVKKKRVLFGHHLLLHSKVIFIT